MEMDAKVFEDRIYSMAEVATIMAYGMSPEALSSWPWVDLPDYVVAEARDRVALPDSGPFEQEELESVLRLRRGLRMEWGVVVAEVVASLESEGSSVVEVAAYLNEDPYLELPHLGCGAQSAGIFLSDLVCAALEGNPDRAIFEAGLSWADNDATGQAFSMIGFSEPGEELNLSELGRRLGRWLLGSNVPALVAACQQTEFLASLDDDLSLPITRMVVC